MTISKYIQIIRIIVSALTIFVVQTLYPVPAFAIDRLNSGEIHTLTPSDTTCVIAQVITPTDAVVPVAKAECDESTGIADVRAGSGRLVTRQVSSTATALFQYPFTVISSPASSNLIPLKLTTVVAWASLLKNTRKIEFAGSSSIDVYLQLRKADGELIARELIYGSRHEGISGCLSIPSDIAATAELALGCFLARFQQADSPATFTSLDAVVEVGESYRIELGVSAKARAKISLDPNDNVVASTPTFVPLNEIPIGRSIPPGLQWSQMTLSLGTDPAVVVGELEEKIEKLRDDLEAHTHDYLTGPGIGHNNNQATSSSANIP